MSIMRIGNKAKKYAIIIFVITPLLIKGQIVDPISGTNTITQPTCDYGPRNIGVGNGSVFHGGFDYSIAGNPLGFPAYAVEAGDILSFYFTSPDAYIQIGNWRYQHIYVGLTTDNLWNFNVALQLLIIKNSHGDVISAYAPEALYPATTYQGVTVQRRFNRGDLVFKAGPYPTSAPHLHIDRGYGGWENPYSFLPRTDNNSPTINNVRLQRDVSGVATIFPSNIIYNSVIIQSDAQSTVEHDLDNLVLSISKDQVNYEPLFQWHYTGNDHINVNRTTGVSNNLPQHNIRIDNTDFDRDTREGIYPIAGVHSRDVFKYSWNSQQTITNTNNVLNYRYLDGNYSIRVIAGDLTNHQSTPNITNVIVDNMRPYIEKVEVRKNQSGGDLVYTGSWTWSSSTSSLSFTKNVTGNIAVNTPLFIKIYTSEPMQNVDISAFNSSLSHPNPVVNTNRKEWEFLINASSITAGLKTITVKSSSLDLAGNGLEGFITTNPLSGSSIPKHQNGGVWSPAASPKDDIIHTIEVTAVSAGVPTNVLATSDLTDKVNLSWGAVVGATHYNVYRNTINNSANALSISGWIISNSYCDQNANPGTNYYYWVKSATSGSGDNASGYSVSVNGIRKSTVTANFNYEQVSYNYSYDVKFFDNSYGSIASRYWDFGDGTSGTEKDPSHSYSHSGMYNVSLTVYDSYNNLSTKYQSVYVNEDYSSSITITPLGGWDNGNNNYEFSVNITDFDNSHIHDVQIFFDDGNMATAYNGISTYHTYQTSITTIKYYPYAIVTTRSNGSIIYQKRVNFNPITLFPPAFTLDLNITIVNLDDYSSSVAPGDHFYLIAKSNGIPPVRYFWLINTNVNEYISCNANTYPTTCLCDEGSYSQNHKFDTEGDYYITLYAVDAVGNQNTKSFPLNVGDKIDPCIFPWYWGIDPDKEIALGDVIKLMNGSLTSCNYNGIYSNDWYYDGILKEHQIFGDWTPFYPVCFPLSTKGPHKIKLKAYGGRYDVNGILRMATNSPYSSITRTYMVVDCEENINILSKNQIIDSKWNVKAGYISFPNNTPITLNRGENLDLNAYKEITFKSGFEVTQGAVLNAKIIPSPQLYNCNCSPPHAPSLETLADDNEAKDASKIKFEVFPNPTTNNITIQYSGDISQILSIEILNSTGTLMFKKTNGFSNQPQFNVEHFSPGVYCVRLVTTSKAISKVFIKS